MSETATAHSKTREMGQKTHRFFAHARLGVLNKDPNFDYSFQRKQDVQEGGAAEIMGWEPVGTRNHKGETWAGPTGSLAKSSAKKAIVYHDTVLCKRHKSITQEIKQQEDEKYNAQKLMVRNAARTAQIKLRQVEESIGLSGSATVQDRSSIPMTQRRGPTQEE